MKIQTIVGTTKEIADASLKNINKKILKETKIAKKKLLQKQIKIYQKHFIQKIIFCDVIAEKLMLPKEQVYSHFLIASQQKQKTTKQKIGAQHPGCSIFGITNKNGSFVARNYDWSNNAKRLFQVHKIAEKNKHHYIGISDMNVLPSMRSPDHFEAEDCINEHGLYIGLTFAHCHKWDYGLLPTHIMQLIAQNCKTVTQALKKFKETPCAVPKNFFIADKSGAMAVVEHDSNKFKILKPKNRILIHTNDYVDPKLAKEDTIFEDNPAANSYIRYYEILQYLNTKKDEITPKSLIRFLHSTRNEVFAHGKKHYTIWSLIIDTKKQEQMLYFEKEKKKKRKKLIF